MKTKLIRIGNSRGVRIPKPLIEQSGLSEVIELTVKDNEIVLRSADGPRKDWDQSFQKMAEQGDDRLLDEDFADASGEWDESEWTW